MTGKPSTDSRQEAVTNAACDAYLAVRSSALRLAEAGGAQIREEFVCPGAVTKIRYSEPLQGIQAARIVQRAADRVHDEYVRHARAEGIGWQQIGDAMGLAEGSRRGYVLAVAAYEQVTGASHLPAFQDPVFYYTCLACHEGITDRGPYESHPQDNEHGHAGHCPHLTAEVAAWQAIGTDSEPSAKTIR